MTDTVFRRGFLPLHGHDDPPPGPDSLLPFIGAASIQGRVALGPDAGRAVDRYRTPPLDAPTFEPGARCATEDGFSLHARVHVGAHERERLEHLCRCITRPAFATERLSLSADGKVGYALRRPWRDGTTHFVFDPLTFIERLAALIANTLLARRILRHLGLPSAAPALAAARAPPQMAFEF